MNMKALINKGFLEHKRRCIRVTCLDKNLNFSADCNNLPAFSIDRLASADLAPGDIVEIPHRFSWMLTDEAVYDFTGLGKVATFPAAKLVGRCKHYRQGELISGTTPLVFHNGRYYAPSSADVRQGDVLRSHGTLYHVNQIGFENQHINQLVVEKLGTDSAE